MVRAHFVPRGPAPPQAPLTGNFRCCRCWRRSRQRRALRAGTMAEVEHQFGATENGHEAAMAEGSAGAGDEEQLLEQPEEEEEEVVAAAVVGDGDGDGCGEGDEEAGQSAAPAEAAGSQNGAEGNQINASKNEEDAG